MNYNDNDEVKMVLLRDEYGIEYGCGDCSEVVLLKQPHKWSDIKKVVEDAKKNFDEEVNNGLYDAIWDALEENFEVEASMSIADTPFYIEW